MKAGVLVAATAALAASAAAQAEEWQWSITPYLWATDVGVDMKVHERTFDTTIAFEDLVEDIKTVAQIRAEAMRGEHGLAMDLFNVALGHQSGNVAVPGGSGAQASIDADIGMTIFDLTGVYDPKGDGWGLRFTYGARLINQREDVDIAVGTGGNAGSSSQFEANDTYIDALVGVRYTARISERWSYTLGADIGTGGTDLTWSVGPFIGYSFGSQQKYRLIAGYRHMVVDFKDEPGSDMELTLSGFLIGFRIGL